MVIKEKRMLRRIGMMGGSGKSMIGLSMAIAYAQQHKIPLSNLIARGPVIECDTERSLTPAVPVVVHPSSSLSEEMALAMSRRPLPVVVVCDSFSDANLLRGKSLLADMVKPMDFIKAKGKKKKRK
jgi:hypothetical protein